MKRRHIVAACTTVAFAGCGGLGSSEKSNRICWLSIGNFDENAPHTLEVVLQDLQTEEFVFWKRLELDPATATSATGQRYTDPADGAGQFRLIARMDGATPKSSSPDYTVSEFRGNADEPEVGVVVQAGSNGELGVFSGRCTDP